MSSFFKVSSLAIFWACKVFSWSSFFSRKALSLPMYVYRSVLSASSSRALSTNDCWRRCCFSSNSLISSSTVLYASSAKNISFFWSMNSLMFYARCSWGNWTRLRAICIALWIWFYSLDVKFFARLGSCSLGAISLSFIRRNGAALVAVFLSQMRRFLAISFASIRFYFSVSRVTNTSSSFGGRKGEV